jgi:DNA mismatch repair protein MutL
MKGDAGLGMIFTTAESPWAKLTALVSAPGVERGAAKDMFLFVNGRWVKDKSLRFAVLRGYHSHLLRGRYPVVAVFLTLDSGLVDANVHPAKTEVRLQYANEIHSMVASAVREALRRGDWAAHASHAALSSSASSGSAAGSVREAKSDIDGLDQRVHSKARWRDVTPEFSSAGSYTASKSSKGSAGWTSPSAPVTRSTNGLFDRLVEPGMTATSPATSATQSIQSIPWRELQYFGSIADCYLLFSHGDRKSGSRLLAVDQHAFHERVLYERLVRNEDLLKSSQTLLVPECVVLDAGAASVIAELKPQLESNGFRIEIIDETTLEVRAVPVLLN